MESPLMYKKRKLNEEEYIENKQEITKARYMFALVGIGYLFPFSALTQPVDYWNLLFPDFNIEFPLTTVYMYTNLVMLGGLVFFGGAPSFTPRILGGFCGQFIVLCFVPTSYFFIYSEYANVIAVLGATSVVAIVTAFLDSSVISLASQYPLRVQESFQLGIGLSTLIGSVYRDVTKLIFPPDAIVESSLLYFYSGAVTILCCIFAYYQLLQLPMTQLCLEKARLAEQQSMESESTPILSSGIDAPPTRKSVFRKIWFNELMVMVLFMSTLALWPPLVTEIKSYNFPNLQASGWWPLLLLTVFSIMDCIGRFTVPYRGIIAKHNIHYFVLFRCVFFFPLIICSVLGIYFTNDLYSVLFVSGLGFTNGYIGTLSIILVNDCITANEQAIAGMFTSFFLNSGLVFGASAGLLVQKLVVGQ